MSKQRDGESNAPEQRDTEHVEPGQLVIKVRVSESRCEPGGAEDADRLAEDQTGDDAERYGVAQRRCQSIEAPISTPAAKNANTGTAMPAEMGRMRCSKCPANPGPASGPPAASERMTGTVKPSSTPATVACTSDS